MQCKIDLNCSFEEHVNYLKSLVNEIQTLEVFDMGSDLIYDIVYADAFLSSIMTQVSDPSLLNDLVSLQIVLSNSMKILPVIKIEAVKKSKDYIKLLTFRYNPNDLPFYRETPMYYLIDDIDICDLYLRKRLYKFLLSCICFGLLIYLPYCELNLNWLSLLISKDWLVYPILVYLGYNLVIFLFDMLYICFPVIRFILDGKTSGKYFSHIYKRAWILVEEGYMFTFLKFKKYERITRDRYHLNAMLTLYEKLIGVGYNISTSRYNSLKSIRDIIYNSHLPFNYSSLLARIEFLYVSFQEEFS